MTATQPILETVAVHKSFGGNPVLHDVNLELSSGSRHALIGPNGAGKTTLFNIICGQLKLSSGEILFEGADIGRLGPHKRAKFGIARTFQRSAVFESLTVRQNVHLARNRVRNETSTAHRPGEATIDVLLEEGGLVTRANEPAGRLSHGEKRQLEIITALATRPRVLLLDEPFAGMSPSERASFGGLIGRLPTDVSVLIIEHDIDALFAIATEVTVLVAGRFLAHGTPDEIRASPTVQAAYLARADQRTPKVGPC